MRKFYSLVLLATVLLIGTNAWAELSTTYDPDEHVASVQINNGTVQYASTLNEAFDAVDYGQTATIILLESGINIQTPINIPHEIVKEKIKEGGMAGPNITLNLNGKSFTAEQMITPFRIMKGSLTIEGQGTISKLPYGGDKWKGEALFSICGAESPSMANWSTLTIEKDVTLSITSNDPENPSHGIAIAVQDFDGLARLGADSLPLGIKDCGYTTGKKDANQQLIKGASEKLRDKYGYCTYYYPERAVISGWVMDYSVIGPGSANVDVLPMECGQPATATAVQQGSAFGVKIFVKGKIYAGERGIQVIGHVNQKPICTENKEKRWKDEAPYYAGQYPYIKVCNTAYIEANEAGGSNGIYVAGYAVCDIEGEVTGATGIYMKAGDVELHDAIVSSNSSTFDATKGAKSGVGKAGGSAIVVESTDAYAGDMGVTLSGDTKVKGDGGYGILEVTSKQDGDATTTHITITGATIESGNEGGIAITDNTTNVTGITGVTTDSPTVTVTNGNTQTTVNVSTLVPNNGNYHSTTTIVDGKTVTVITQGAAPIEAPGTDLTDWDFIKGYSDTASSLPNMKWEAIEQATIASGVTVKLGELQIISGDANNPQVLTIHDGACLDVNTLIMNDYAQIIVEAGGKLIVEGTQGIVAKKDINIKLESNATKQAIFLFNPGVSSNKHPNATVQYVATKSYRVSANDYQWERFGVPTWKALNSIKCTTADVYSYVRVYENGWQDLGWIHNDDEFANLARMNKPFATYNMLTYVDDKVLGHEKATYVMTGELVGNMDATLNANLEWNAFTNSYSAEIDVKEMLLSLANANYIEKGVYTAEGGGNGIYVWDAVDMNWIDRKEDKQKLAPMQAFILRNEGLIVEDFTLDYEKMVWDPVMDPTHQVASVSGAPRRAGSADDESARLRIIVANEQGAWDNVKLTENATASSLKKYMNDDVNIYAMADEKAAIVAAEDLEDSYFGFSTVKGGEFTISFADVEGREFDLIDLETGVKVAVMEGETYSFVAAANTVADYRFKLVERAKLPTAIENTEAVKTVKGVYTITGQYLGEMNVWNTLPAGVYVVNGEKLVK